MPEDKSFAFSTSIEPDTAADYLEALARQLRSGSAQLASAGTAINLEFAGPIKFDLEAGSTRGSGTLGVRLSWKEPVRDDPNTMTIRDAKQEDVVAGGAPEPAAAGVAAEEN